MTASEAGAATGTALLILVTVTIAFILTFSLVRRVKRTDEKHMNGWLYWPLFIIGTLFVLSQVISWF